MTRFLAALVCFGAAFMGVPSRSEAGVIPWMYDAIFGYGHAGYGGGYGGGYMTGYAPAYPPRYVARMYRASYAFGGNYGYGMTTNYAPWYGGYSDGGACCSPCGTGSCSPCGGGACGTGSCGTGACGTGCDNGCGTGCSGGNCPGSGTTTVPSNPSNANDRGGAQPTYAPPTNDRTPPQDQFGPARNRDGLGAGANAPSTTPANNFRDFNSTAEPNNSAPNFNPAPAEPGNPRREKRNEDNGSVTPRLSPINPGDKVAFKTPARFTRSNIEPTFQLPTIVSAPPRTLAEPAATPAVVASK